MCIVEFHKIENKTMTKESKQTKKKPFLVMNMLHKEFSYKEEMTVRSLSF